VVNPPVPSSAAHLGESIITIKLLTSAVILFILVHSASAGVTISGQFSSALVPGIADHRSFTLVATTDDGSHIQGFDFATQPEYGIWGPMNQVNPVGFPTLYDDFPLYLHWIFVSPADSHFKFTSTDLTIAPGYGSESANHLRALFTINSPLKTSVRFVQLVLPSLATVQGIGLVQTVANSQTTFHSVSFQVSNPIPEPALAGMLAVALIIYRGFVDRRRSAA